MILIKFFVYQKKLFILIYFNRQTQTKFKNLKWRWNCTTLKTIFSWFISLHWYYNWKTPYFNCCSLLRRKNDQQKFSLETASSPIWMGWFRCGNTWHLCWYSQETNNRSCYWSSWSKTDNTNCMGTSKE